MRERNCVPFGRGRLQSETLVVPLKIETVRSDALQKYEKATDSLLGNPFNTSAGHNIKSVIAELDKRWSEQITLSLEVVAKAQEALAKAREAEERREQAENRLEQETNQRLVAERRLKEFEEDRQRLLQAVEIEKVITLKAALAHREVTARLKEAEGQINEAENEARAVTIALADADRKIAEAAATARAAEEEAHEIKALFLGEDAADRKDTERRLAFGFLIFSNKRRRTDAHEAKKIHKAAEAELLYKADHTALAELNPTDSEGLLSSDLEFDWSKSETDVIQVSVARDSNGTNESTSHIMPSLPHRPAPEAKTKKHSKEQSFLSGLWKAIFNRSSPRSA